MSTNRATNPNDWVGLRPTVEGDNSYLITVYNPDLPSGFPDQSQAKSFLKQVLLSEDYLHLDTATLGKDVRFIYITGGINTRIMVERWISGMWYHVITIYPAESLNDAMRYGDQRLVSGYVKLQVTTRPGGVGDIRGTWSIIRIDQIPPSFNSAKFEDLAPFKVNNAAVRTGIRIEDGVMALVPAQGRLEYSRAMDAYWDSSARFYRPVSYSYDSAECFMVQSVAPWFDPTVNSFFDIDCSEGGTGLKFCPALAAWRQNFGLVKIRVQLKGTMAVNRPRILLRVCMNTIEGGVSYTYSQVEVMAASSEKFDSATFEHVFIQHAYIRCIALECPNGPPGTNMFSSVQLEVQSLTVERDQSLTVIYGRSLEEQALVSIEGKYNYEVQPGYRLRPDVGNQATYNPRNDDISVTHAISTHLADKYNIDTVFSIPEAAALRESMNLPNFHRGTIERHAMIGIVPLLAALFRGIIAHGPMIIQGAKLLHDILPGQRRAMMREEVDTPLSDQPLAPQEERTTTTVTTRRLMPITRVRRIQQRGSWGTQFEGMTPEQPTSVRHAATRVKRILKFEEPAQPIPLHKPAAGVSLFDVADTHFSLREIGANTAAYKVTRKFIAVDGQFRATTARISFTSLNHTSSGQHVQAKFKSLEIGLYGYRPGNTVLSPDDKDPVPYQMLRACEVALGFIPANLKIHVEADAEGGTMTGASLQFAVEALLFGFPDDISYSGSANPDMDFAPDEVMADDIVKMKMTAPGTKVFKQPLNSLDTEAYEALLVETGLIQMPIVGPLPVASVTDVPIRFYLGARKAISAAVAEDEEEKELSYLASRIQPPLKKEKFVKETVKLSSHQQELYDQLGVSVEPDGWDAELVKNLTDATFQADLNNYSKDEQIQLMVGNYVELYDHIPEQGKAKLETLKRVQEILINGRAKDSEKALLRRIPGILVSMITALPVDIESLVILAPDAKKVYTFKEAVNALRDSGEADQLTPLAETTKTLGFAKLLQAKFRESQLNHIRNVKQEKKNQNVHQKNVKKQPVEPEIALGDFNLKREEEVKVPEPKRKKESHGTKKSSPPEKAGNPFLNIMKNAQATGEGIEGDEE